MYHLPLSAISLNSAYRGRRFTTPKLKQFKEDMAVVLPRIKVPKGKLAITFLFGVSSKMSDTDNLVKCTLDSLATQFGFNDRCVYRIVAEKIDVKKGQEFIDFSVDNFLPSSRILL